MLFIAWGAYLYGVLDCSSTVVYVHFQVVGYLVLIIEGCGCELLDIVLVPLLFTLVRGRWGG